MFLEKLSAALGEKGGKANKALAEEAALNSNVLIELSEGLKSPDVNIAADCAEVFCETAAKEPSLVQPYLKYLSTLFESKSSRARWESVHAFAHVAKDLPEEVAAFTDSLWELYQKDKSAIVRDYSLLAIANVAASNKENAQAMFDILFQSGSLYGGRHLKFVLEIFPSLMEFCPDKEKELFSLLDLGLHAPKKNIVKLSEKWIKKYKE